MGELRNRDTSDLPLAAEFPPATRADWMKLVDAVIKGAPFERKLVGKTYDDLRIEPLYERAADARPVTGRAPAAPWQIIARVDHPDPAAANAQALHDLENGATGLSLVIAGSNGSFGFGLEDSEAAIGRALDGIHLDAGIAVDIDSSPHTDTARLVAAMVKRHGIRPAAVDIRFGLDPLAGRPSRWKAVAPRFAAAVCDLADQGFSGPFAVADARPVHAAGGSEAQELAFVLASARCLSARARSRRRRARRGAQHDLFPAGRGCRSVPHDRQVPRAAQAVGAGRGGVRARAAADLHRGRDGLAHDDQTRPACEHAAHDHRGLFGRPRRRRCDQRSCRSPRRSACPMASRGALRAIRS